MLWLSGDINCRLSTGIKTSVKHSIVDIGGEPYFVAATTDIRSDVSVGKLPHLNRLRLFGDPFTGKHITFLSGGFPKLRLLNLWKLPLQDWTVKEEGTMPCLNELEIRDC
ncbi:hypothetical protein Ddye_011230 [Dipteronia dyeriana]|uniref:Uncharacterized protein n=1 Tax=Dipteronia dyeriana TaxID=168575 RepID=A0AAD9X181_9ROSI|nr:hypothetical protein Ddye_011230 [Dipteronia dyeriana]